MRNGVLIPLIFLVAGLFVACQKEFDISTLPRQPDTLLDTSYVELFPPFGGFAGAEDIAVGGNDGLLYVADTRANRIVMMNRAGQIMSARTMLHPRSIGSWRNLRAAFPA